MIIESISGVRGIIGNGLDPRSVTAYASALSVYLKGRGHVVLGRDSRPSGAAITALLSETLSWAGIDVTDLGVVPTPTVQLLVESMSADAGIAVTASHNPFPWNGLKFIDRTGRFFNAEQVGKLMGLKNASAEPAFKGSGEFGAVKFYADAMKNHISNVLEIPWLNVDEIRRRKFKVAVDAVNGGASVFIPELLEALGCEVIALNCTPDGYFPHTPEPLPENLTDLTEAVKKSGADLGMAVDPDGDRLAVIDGNGRYLSEEYTLVMAVKTVLGKNRDRKPLVVTNLSTTKAVDDVVKALGGQVMRTAIGEINVSQTMAEEGALIGGEGNGGIILPDSHLGRDSLVGAALVLQFIADHSEPLSVLYDGLPMYRMSKKKMELGNISPDSVISDLRKSHDKDNINTVDGLKISYSDSWVHIRKSNTEPIIRIYSEAPTYEEAAALGDAIIKEVSELTGK